MGQQTQRFEVEGFDGGIESKIVEDRIVILYQGFPVISFDVKEPTARDWTIAALLDIRLKGKTIAELCHVSPAQVSKVRKLVRQGGPEALVHPRTGRPRKLTGSTLVRAIARRRKGETLAEIGSKLGVSANTVCRALEGIPRGGRDEPLLEAVGAGPCSDGRATVPPSLDTGGSRATSSMTSSETVPEASSERRELVPAMPLPPGPAEHRCRYAGTLLVVSAAQELGLSRAMSRASVRRPETSQYSAWQAVVALVSAWAGGLASLEAMHERDARALGVVLGTERSPSVRTLHRAIAQMVSVFDPIALQTGLLQGLMSAVGGAPRVFGVDGHFKPYYGREPIDKGWDTKRRMAQRGLADVLVHDDEGRLWLGVEVGAGDGLHEHILSLARQLRSELGATVRVVLAFDRGGFSFDVLAGLDREGFGYVAWVPASVTLPDLSRIAPPDDGVGATLWDHPKLIARGGARLLVQRDGEALVPAVTNLNAEIPAEEALGMLRRVRGFQENDIKAARSFAHIDRLVDRGGARRAADDRLVVNPAYRELSTRRQEVRGWLAELEGRVATTRCEEAVFGGEQLMAELEEALLSHQLEGVPSKVPRVELEPEAQRAWLETRNRSLLQPLKYLLANSRRWLLGALGPALTPSDAEWDGTAASRTLEGLLHAPGTVIFGARQVEVTLELPLAPQPHQRLSQGLATLDSSGLLFSDRKRPVVFRLAPRPTRDALAAAAKRR